MHAMLKPTVREQLHADADPEEGALALQNGVAQSLDHSRRPLKALIAIAKRAHPRQHNAIGAPDGAGIGRHGDVRRDSALPRCALKSLCRRMQISRLIIDDCNKHGGYTISSGTAPARPGPDQAPLNIKVTSSAGFSTGFAPAPVTEGSHV